MWRLAGLLLLAICCVSCGESEPEEKPTCVGEECEAQECEAESDLELCEAAAATCGEMGAKDRCGETRWVSCGSCGLGQACEDNSCKELPTQEDRPCILVPPEGDCAGLRTLEKCQTLPDGKDVVVTTTCEMSELCVVDDEGARCEPIAEPCEEEISFCTGPNTLMTCIGGLLGEENCPSGCTGYQSGAICRPNLPGTILHRGKIFYEHNQPNESLTAWVPVVRPAGGLYVMSYVGGLPADTAVVNDDGSFELLVAKEAGEKDQLIFMAYGTLLGGNSARYGTVYPDMPEGVHDFVERGPEYRYWSWQAPHPHADEILIDFQKGAHAIQIFQGLKRSAEKAAAYGGPFIYGANGVYQPGVAFTCGACFVKWEPTSFILFSPNYAGIDAVIFHESGHYLFESNGIQLFEAGPHCLGVPAPPGQALSEGHASWFSADIMKNPRIAREALGTVYYMDLENMEPTEVFEPPSPELGPLQNINEIWISAALWRLASENGSSAPIHLALSREELKAPLASDYEGHGWRTTDDACQPLDPVPMGEQTPTFSDFLDALVCHGFPASHVDAAVLPHFPYDSSEPTCK